MTDFPDPQRSLWARPIFEVLDDADLDGSARWPEPWMTHEIGAPGE